jgi:hypothetical protein
MLKDEASPKPEAGKEPAKPAADTPGQKPAEAVSLADFRASQEKITALGSQLGEMTTTLGRIAESLASNRSAPVQPTSQTAPDVTDAELQKALQDGDPAALRRMQNANNARLLAAVQQLVEPLRVTGTKAISDITNRVMRASMPHYELLKNDVDKMLDSLDPAIRMQPETVEHVYNIAVGKNVDKIVATEVEKQLRQSREADAATGGGGDASSRQVETGATELKEFAEIVGPDAMAALKTRKQTPEQFVARQGYASIEAWLKVAKEQGEPEGAAA